MLLAASKVELLEPVELFHMGLDVTSVVAADDEGSSEMVASRDEEDTKLLFLLVAAAVVVPLMAGGGVVGGETELLCDSEDRALETAESLSESSDLIRDEGTTLLDRVGASFCCLSTDGVVVVAGLEPLAGVGDRGCLGGVGDLATGDVLPPLLL